MSLSKDLQILTKVSQIWKMSLFYVRTNPSPLFFWWKGGNRWFPIKPRKGISLKILGNWFQVPVLLYFLFPYMPSFLIPWCINHCGLLLGVLSCPVLEMTPSSCLLLGVGLEKEHEHIQGSDLTTTPRFMSSSRTTTLDLKDYPNANFHYIGIILAGKKG